MPETPRFCVGNEEQFYGSYATVEAAIADAHEQMPDLEGGETIYVGTIAPFVPSIDADDVVDRLREQAYEHAGEEPTEDWLAHVPPEQKADLERRLLEALQGWLKDHHLEPTFYGVENITPHTAPPKED